MKLSGPYPTKNVSFSIGIVLDHIYPLFEAKVSLPSKKVKRGASIGSVNLLL